jgi:hypothetical protein
MALTDDGAVPVSRQQALTGQPEQVRLPVLQFLVPLSLPTTQLG